MIQIFDNIEKADINAILTYGQNFLVKLEILKSNRVARRLYENDIDAIIKVKQDLELKYITSKMNGDFDSSVNGDFILD